MKNLLFVFSLLSLLAVQSCKNTPKDTANVDSLATQLTLLQDSLGTIWEEMVASDRQKVRDIKQLLADLRTTGKYPAARLDSLQILSQTLPPPPYNADSLAAPAIDAYDRHTIRLMDGITQLTDSQVDFKDDLPAFSLWNNIRKADEEVINFRLRYEKFVQAYNKILTEHGELLAEEKPEFKNLKSRPGFQVAP
jgi:hypothetical protein